MIDPVSDAELDEMFDQAVECAYQAGIARLQELVNAAQLARLRSESHPPRTSAERHWREHGHQLSPGCCRVSADGTGAAAAGVVPPAPAA